MSLVETYEQQISSISADITNRVGRFSSLTGLDRTHAVSYIERCIADLYDVLEQLELEIRDMPLPMRQKCTTRLKGYKAEATRLSDEFKRVRTEEVDSRARHELIGGPEICDDQRARLLDNCETLERSGRRLEGGYKVALETEEIGSGILSDLHFQRETIQKSRQRLREMKTDLGKSSRLLTTMTYRVIQNKIILFAMGFIMLFVVVLVIYFKISK